MRTLALLLAESTKETALRFKSAPPLWLLIMVILPVAAAIVIYVYRRESPTASPKVRRVLGIFRFVTILFVLFLLFDPYAETTTKKHLKSHLVVLIDSSASMEFVDTYSDPAKAKKLARAAELGSTSPSEKPRIDLVKRVLAGPRSTVLDRLSAKFFVHVYTFDSNTVLLGDSGEAAGNGPGGKPLETQIRGIRADGAWTMIGDSITSILDEYRQRDEPLAGIVLITDGRQNGGQTTPIKAARRAAAERPSVPIFVVGVGDPDLPRNIHVSNLTAREVVLRGDDVSFDFTVSQKGFAGKVVTASLSSLDDKGRKLENLDLSNADVVLGPDGKEQSVHVTHHFDRSGDYTLKIGIPVVKGEKIESDNFLIHHLRVVDKKIKVLFVDGYPRWEYRYLKDALVRDTDTVLAHVINLSADPEGVVQPYSKVPGWGPIDHFPRTKKGLFDYDVVIFGDVDWTHLADTPEASQEILSNIKQFVEDGGGFIMIAGERDSPRAYRNTPIEDILPVVLSRQDESVVRQDSTMSFNLKLTPEGEKNPVMQLDNDPRLSKRLWEKDKFSAQFWYYPVERAKTPATVLAVHPGQMNENEFGPRVIMALMQFGKGTSLFIGVDELWRLRFTFGNRYFYRFYGEAIRLLATPRLLGGNKRFKIFTDRDSYFVGDPVEISAKVYDRDFNPSRASSQTVTVQAPDGQQQEVTLRRNPDEPGSYSQMITVYQEGTYRVTGDLSAGMDDQPERLFRVEYSTAEMKNPLVDPATLAGIARESGSGTYIPLSDADTLPDRIPPRSVLVSSEVHTKDIWDEAWVMFVFTALLAAEWLIRKRYRMI